MRGHTDLEVRANRKFFAVAFDKFYDEKKNVSIMFMNNGEDQTGTFDVNDVDSILNFMMKFCSVGEIFGPMYNGDMVDLPKVPIYCHFSTIETSMLMFNVFNRDSALIIDSSVSKGISGFEFDLYRLINESVTEDTKEIIDKIVGENLDCNISSDMVELVAAYAYFLA